MTWELRLGIGVEQRLRTPADEGPGDDSEIICMHDNMPLAHPGRAVPFMY